MAGYWISQIRLYPSTPLPSQSRRFWRHLEPAVDAYFGKRDSIHTKGMRLKRVTLARRQAINAKLADQYRLGHSCNLGDEMPGLAEDVQSEVLYKLTIQQK